MPARILKQAEQYASAPYAPQRNDRVNPIPDFESTGRPDPAFTGEQGHAPTEGTLPGSPALEQRQPIQLFRGMQLPLSGLPRELQQHLTGRGGLFRGQPGPLSQDFAHRLLEHTSQRGLGSHWSTDPAVARSFSGKDLASPQHLPLVVGGQWRGLGENSTRDWHSVGYPDEAEISLHPGAPVDVNEVHLRHPVTGEWQSVKLDQPHPHYARRNHG